MPGFGQVLRKNVNCWSLGYQVAKECDETRTRGPHVMRDDCLEIFPGGGFIFITDEVFEQKPQLALKIIQLFCEKVEGVKGLDGPLNRHHIVTAPVFWRLHVRPELMEFLFNECVARERALGEGHPEVLA
jgi:chromo domain-containing protein 1